MRTDVSPLASSVSPASSIVPKPARCPKDLFGRRWHHGVPGVQHTLVPGDPPALVLCGVGKRVVVEGSRVHSLAAMLNALKLMPPGSVYAFACPLDLGPIYGLFFDYANGHVLLVTVDAGGCRFASNGRRTARSNDAVLTRIRTLLRSS